jgi:hypothetical protein
MFLNPLVIAAAAGMFVWLADQPTVPGYNPLLAMFWDTGLGKLPLWDSLVLLCSWVLTTLFVHFLLFTLQRFHRIRSTGSR